MVEFCHGGNMSASHGDDHVHNDNGDDHVDNDDDNDDDDGDNDNDDDDDDGCTLCAGQM